jgi:cytochrome c oxidase subunit 4
MSSHDHVASPAEKKALYIKVFVALIVCTILGIGSHYIPGSPFIRGPIIITIGSLKAFLVGYYFMHLNHESKWLRIIAALPLFMLLYTFVLIPDSALDSTRKNSVYLPVRERVLPAQTEHGHAGAGEAAPHAAATAAPTEKTAAPAEGAAKPSAADEFR